MPADADVDDVDLRRQAAGGEQAPRHLGAEAVVGEEDVADPGDEDPHDALPGVSRPRARRAGSTGTGRGVAWRSAPGSSSIETATWVCRRRRAGRPARWPRRPRRNVSCASLPGPGMRITGAAARHRSRRPPARRRMSGSTDASAPGSHHGVPGVTRVGTVVRRRGRPPGRTVPCSRSNIAGPMASSASRMSGRPRVGGPRLALLVVGEGERAQAEDLVVLGAVEEVGRALRGELRVVVEDDRRREQQPSAALGARPAPASCAR